jgi:hypothetical protein
MKTKEFSFEYLKFLEEFVVSKLMKTFGVPNRLDAFASQRRLSMLEDEDGDKLLLMTSATLKAHFRKSDGSFIYFTFLTCHPAKGEINGNLSL